MGSKSRWEGSLIISLDLIALGRGCGSDSVGAGQNPVVGCCGHGNAPLGSVKGRQVYCPSTKTCCKLRA